MSDSNFARPAENLASDARNYVGAQWDNVKLRSVKALSAGTGKIFWVVLVFILVAVLVLTLSFAFVLWIGEALGSYAAGAFIVSGALLLILVVVFLLRKVLFRNTLVSSFVKSFFPHGNEVARNQNDLEKAILRNEVALTREECRINQSFGEAKSFYTSPASYMDGATSIVSHIVSLFEKKKEEKEEKKAAKEQEQATKAEAKAQEQTEKAGARHSANAEGQDSAKAEHSAKAAAKDASKADVQEKKSSRSRKTPKKEAEE